MSIAIPDHDPLALPPIRPTQTANALRRLRYCLTRNTVRSVLAGSRLRLSMIVFCSLVFWIGLFGLFLGGFEFIGLSDELFNAIFEYLFSMFFLSILIMLFFSTGIITYTGLFHSREGVFLLSTPATTDRIFAYKFAEAVAMSSWGFFLLGSPLMVAYGLTIKAPIAFYGMFLVYLFMFVMIAGSLGAIAAILVANVFPKRQKLVLAGAGLATLGLLAGLAMRIWNTPGATLTSDWLGSVQERLAFCQHPLWPSRWMSAGLLASGRGNWPRAGYYLMVLSAHAGLGYLIAAAVARDLYFRGFNRVQGGRTSRRRLALDALDRLFHRGFFFLSRPVRLLILKDLRTFLRDPAQWSQFLIFFGLLAFYFLNIPRLGYGIQSPSWRNLISFLNLAVTALILSTFTSRFIFPLLSLEGRNFWVLGLFPLRREQILWGKFAFSVGISLGATELLVFLSDMMLGMGAVIIALHVAMVAVLCLGLSGISVGLGARLPNLRESDPSKIAVGFGGTLNLLVSLVFIFSLVTALAVPCHLYFLGIEYPASTRLALSNYEFRFWLTVAILVSLAIGAAGTIIPLRIGIKAFQRMEF
ncbi:MAG: putative ABC transporter permease subunit [Isosphaeraceae bacterium]